MKRRVVITGLGAIAPNGIGTEAFWKALLAGRSGVDRIRSFDASGLPCQIAGEVRAFDPADYLAPKLIKRLSWVAQLGVCAAKMAAQNARLDDLPGNRIGVAFGTNLGKEDAFDKDHNLFLQKGAESIGPLSGEAFTPHYTTSHIAVELGARGPLASFSSGCITFHNAIAWGYDQIHNGDADAVVIAAAESLLSPFPFAAVCASGLLSTAYNDRPQQAAKPYDARRDGYVLGEGSAAIILEARSAAIDRGVAAYAELLGHAVSSEAIHVHRFDVSGKAAAQTIQAALHRSRLDRTAIDYICAMGISTRDHDLAETNAIKLAFGQSAYHIPVSSIKSMIGHPGAAAIAFQIVACCMGLRDDRVPPTINYEVPDPACDLDYVANKSRVVRLRHALIHAQGFGASHAAMVLADPSRTS